MEQAVLLLSLFMGVAIPVLFYLLLLAFGAFLSADTSANQAILIAYSVILAQSILLQLFKAGILGSRYTLFLNSVSFSIWQRHLTNMLLALIANPLILLNVFILLSIDFSRWGQIPHGFALLSLQILSTYLILTGSQRFNSSLLMCLPLLIIAWLFASDWSAFIMLLGLHVFLGVFYFVPNVSLPLVYRLPSSISLWFGIFLNKSSSNDSNAPFVLLSICLLCLTMGAYSQEQMPQYAQGIAFIVLQFMVLFCVALQLSVNRLASEHVLFLGQYNSLSVAFMYKQFLPVIMSLCVAFLLHYVIFFEALTLLIQVPFAVLCLFIAKKHASMLMIGWLISIAGSGLLSFLQ